MDTPRELTRKERAELQGMFKRMKKSLKRLLKKSFGGSLALRVVKLPKEKSDEQGD